MESKDAFTQNGIRAHDGIALIQIGYRPRPVSRESKLCRRASPCPVDYYARPGNTVQQA